jgi:hypothetical protein
MTSFLGFLDTYRNGILMLLLLLLVLVFLVQWFAWIFAKGRFARPGKPSHNLRFVFSEAAVKIINDFRHLLALIVIIIFGSALAFTLIQTRGSLADMKEALQSVVATLGGLVGSIIGYYFGESTVVKAQEPGQPSPGSATPAIQQAVEPITPAPAPPVGAIESDEDSQKEGS